MSASDAAPVASRPPSEEAGHIFSRTNTTSTTTSNDRSEDAFVLPSIGEENNDDDDAVVVVSNDGDPATPTSTSPSPNVVVHSWDVLMTPPETSVKGRVVPRSLRKRRVDVELRRDGAGPSTLRVSAPPKGGGRRRLLSRISAHSVDDASSRADDDDDLSAFSDASSTSAASTSSTFREKYRFLLHRVLLVVDDENGNGRTMSLVVGDVCRDVVFPSASEARRFASVVREDRGREVSRARALAARRGRGSISSSRLGRVPDADLPLCLLVEIVSARGPPSARGRRVVVVATAADGRTLHETEPAAARGSDPVWTLTTGSFFLLETTPRELFANDDDDDHHRGGARFELQHRLGPIVETSLGHAWFGPRELTECGGARMEKKLEPVPGKTDSGKGYIAVRCREATEHDVSFLKAYQRFKSKPKVSQMVATAAASIEEPPHMVLKRESGLVPAKAKILKKTSFIDKDGVERRRVKPGPDPDRIASETEWLTKDQIEECARSPSTRWIEAGHGDLGRIFLEIIGCDELRVARRGPPGPLAAARARPDPFVSIVYEDCHLYTDLLEDCASPRWPSWSRRAFVLRLSRPSSQIHVGVFDHDAVAGNHELIGRVTIDATRARPDVVYDWVHDLRTTARCRDDGGGDRGRLRVRARAEHDSPRALVLEAWRPTPPTTALRSTNRKRTRVARETCRGKPDPDRFGTEVIASCLEELTRYSWAPRVWARSGLRHAWLWRGHYELEIGPVKTSLPLHSVAAFVAATSVVERPELLPTYVFGSIGWALLATNTFRSKDPCPWRGDHRTFGETAAMLLFDKERPPVTVVPHQNRDRVEVHDREWRGLFEREEERRREEARLAAEESEENADDVVDESEPPKERGVAALNPLRPLLLPIQRWLTFACEVVRFVKAVLEWEESYYAFWTCASSLALAIVSYFVPWRWLTLWTCRVVVWTLFGPWIKLVDVFYVRPLEARSSEDRNDGRGASSAPRDDDDEDDDEPTPPSRGVVDETAPVRRETALKLRDLRAHLFGSFVARVDLLKLDRRRDTPLPESSAAPFAPTGMSLGELAIYEEGTKRTRVLGQRLEGDMIPTRVGDAPGHKREALRGRPFVNKAMLRRAEETNGRRPLSDDDAWSETQDSTLTAMVKVGSVLVGTAIGTWWMVPILIGWTWASTSAFFERVWDPCWDMVTRRMIGS